MVKLTGLWKLKTAKGQTFLAGQLGVAKVLIFKNGSKRSDKEPDYNLYIDEVKPAAGGADKGSAENRR